MKTTFAIFREVPIGKKIIVIFPYIVDCQYQVLHMEDFKFSYQDYFTTMKTTNEPTSYTNYNMLDIRKYLRTIRYKIRTIEEADENLLIKILQIKARQNDPNRNQLSEQKETITN